MSEYRRHLVLEKHFSGACGSCPMSGKRAPEVVAGRLESLLESVWQNSESTILHNASLYSLTADDMSRLRADMLHAKGVQTSLLQIKCSYWTSLPWCLIGVAHHDEAVARKCAKSSLQKFDKDPRAPPVQHHISWTLLKPGALFRSELQRFIDGESRWALHADVQVQIAAWCFIPIVETTIEAKHAYVSSENKKHHIGPTRVSLANRLPLLERLLLRDPSFIIGFLEDFESARSMKAIPDLLGFTAHPLLGGGNLASYSTSEMVPLVSSIFYHCDLENSYRSLRVVKKLDTTERGKRSRDEANVSRTFFHSGQDTILRLAIADHFRKTYTPGKFYSIPAAAEANHTSLDAYVESTATQVAENARRKRARASGEELLAIEDAHPECRDIYFQVALDTAALHHPTHTSLSWQAGPL